MIGHMRSRAARCPPDAPRQHIACTHSLHSLPPRPCMPTWVSSALFQVLVVMEDSVHALSKLAAAARRRLSPPPATAPGAPAAAVDGHRGGAEATHMQRAGVQAGCAPQSGATAARAAAARP